MSCARPVTEIPLTVHLGRTTPNDIVSVLGNPATTDGDPTNGTLQFKDNKGNTERRMDYMIRTTDRVILNLTACLENGQCLSRKISPYGTMYGYTSCTFEFENDILIRAHPITK